MYESQKIADTRLTAPDRIRIDISEIIRNEMLSGSLDGDEHAILKLVEFIRKGNGTVLLEVIKENFKYGKPETQILLINILDKCLKHSGLHFAVLLSSEKWTERFFKVAKSTRFINVRRKIILTIIEWNERYHTAGHQSLLQRFSNSKVLGSVFQALQKEREASSNEANTLPSPQQLEIDVKNLNLTDVDTNRILDSEEAMLLEFHGDLTSLLYILEHPQMMGEHEIAVSCRNDKLKCMRLLETGLHERIAPAIMALIEGFSESLELYEAMSGQDLGEGFAAKERALYDEGEYTDSTDDGVLKTKKLTSLRTSADEAMMNAERKTQELIDNERMEARRLQQQLEDLRREHETLRNKYMDVKSKNKQIVALLNQYAERADMEKGTLPASDPLVSPPVIAPIIESKILNSNLSRMYGLTRVIRQNLQEMRDHYCADVAKECQYYTTQLSNRVASILQATQLDRSADQKALQWTQELYKREMKLRKLYYNTIQELKGNIRVYCRVRPMIPKEIEGGHKNIMSYPSTGELKFTDASGRPKLFEFDEVYPPDTPQTKVFADTEPLISSVVDGYNVCIFAYGQTGSGKTYTMGGEGEEKGINIRALEQLFHVIAEREETEESTVSVSVLEIYCEQIRDLLIDQGEASGKDYSVKQGGPYGTYVTNLSEIMVKSPSEIHAVMQAASSHRSEGTTDMNEHSSRSHMILYVIVRTTNKQTNMQSYGKLSLVDLAGSERLDKSGAEGQLLKEAVAINKSLSALGDVISSLANNNKHIPFRNSILTFLLQDSMGGQAKVLMFVCVSPASYNVNESGSSLMFASRARGVELGQVRKNVVVEKKS